MRIPAWLDVGANNGVHGRTRPQHDLKPNLMLLAAFLASGTSGRIVGQAHAPGDQKQPAVRITSLSPEEIREINQSVKLTIRGKRFAPGSHVRLTYLRDEIAHLDLRPERIAPDQINITIGEDWFKALANVPRPPTKLPVSARIPADHFSARVVSPDGQASNFAIVRINRNNLRITRIEPEKVVRVPAGMEQEITVTIDRGKWEGEVPLHVLAFEAPRRGRPPQADRQPRKIETSPRFQIRGIAGSGRIPPGQNAGRARIRVEKGVPAARYQLFVYIPTQQKDSVRVGLSSTIDLLVSKGPIKSGDMPPGSPWDFQITGTTDKSITISWLDVNEEFTLGGFRWHEESGCEVQRRIPGGTWTTVASLGPSGGAGMRGYDDNGLMPGTKYCYRVKVWNAYGEAFSDPPEVCATTGAPPVPPVGLAAYDSTETSISVTWQDIAMNETGYELERHPSGGSWSTFKSVGPLTGWQSYTDTGLAPNTDYYYRLKVFNAYGFAYSTEVYGKTEMPAPPLLPPLANLDISGSHNFSPWFPGPDDPFDFSFVVVNSGGSKANPFAVTLEWTGPAGTEHVTHPNVLPYPPGLSVTWNYSFPDGLPEGDYYWYVQLDIFNNVPESVEENTYFLGNKIIW